MSVFGLVHGAWHGAWCWEPLVAELERRGHRAVAVDLPASDREAGCARYAEITAAALDGAGDDVVLVGHSLGGLTIPLVAAARPVRRMVFVCALLPEPGSSFDDQVRAERGILARGIGAVQQVHPDGSTSWPPEAAVPVFYSDCAPALASWAAARLRPQAWTPTQEDCPLDAIPDVERTYVLADDDRMVTPAWSRVAARERLGVQAVELPGGHSPFLSRPAELAALLT